MSLGVLAALAGCGGSSGLSRQALISRADAVCASADDRAAAASARIKVPHDPDGPREAFIKTAPMTLRIAEGAAAQLRELTPPSGLAADWRRFVGDVEKENAGGRSMLQDAETQNTIGAAETQQSLEAVELDLEAVSERIGFQVCGKPARAGATH